MTTDALRLVSRTAPLDSATFWRGARGSRRPTATRLRLESLENRVVLSAAPTFPCAPAWTPPQIPYCPPQIQVCVSSVASLFGKPACDPRPRCDVQPSGVTVPPCETAPPCQTPPPCDSAPPCQTPPPCDGTPVPCDGTTAPCDTPQPCDTPRTCVPKPPCDSTPSCETKPPCQSTPSCDNTPSWKVDNGRCETVVREVRQCVQSVQKEICRVVDSCFGDQRFVVKLARCR